MSNQTAAPVETRASSALRRFFVSAAGRNSGRRKLGIFGQRSRIRNRTVECNPVSLRHVDIPISELFRCTALQPCHEGKREPTPTHATR